MEYDLIVAIIAELWLHAEIESEMTTHFLSAKIVVFGIDCTDSPPNTCMLLLQASYTAHFWHERADRNYGRLPWVSGRNVRVNCRTREYKMPSRSWWVQAKQDSLAE